jgi:hypothetical protein
MLVGVVASRPLAHALGTSRSLAWAVVVALGIVLAATLTPVHDAPDLPWLGPLRCDLSRVGLPPWQDLTTINDRSLNVLLFVPLGIALGLLPRSMRKLDLVLAAAVLPLAIEMAQLVLAPLNRTCQSADVFDNLVGLAIGLALGSLAGAVALRRRPSAPREPAGPA